MLPGLQLNYINKTSAFYLIFLVNIVQDLVAMMKVMKRENKPLETINMINYMMRYCGDCVEEFSKDKIHAS